MHAPGLTLLELLITLTVVAILTFAGVPLFQELQANNRMTVQINSLVHAVFMAKQSAHVRLTESVLCRSSSGRQCEPQPDWSAGWLLFMNNDRDHPPQVDPDEPVLATGRRFAGTISVNRRAFVFRPFEKRSTNGTFVFCDRRGSQAARALIISYTGRPRVAAARPDQSPLTCPE